MDSARFEKYDPTTDVWTTVSPMLTARGLVAVFHSTRDGCLVALAANSSSVEKYDPVADVWTSGPALPNALSGYLSCAALSMRVDAFDQLLSLAGREPTVKSGEAERRKRRRE